MVFNVDSEFLYTERILLFTLSSNYYLQSSSSQLIRISILEGFVALLPLSEATWPNSSQMRTSYLQVLSSFRDLEVVEGVHRP